MQCTCCMMELWCLAIFSLLTLILIHPGECFPHFEGENEEPVEIKHFGPRNIRERRSDDGFPDGMNIELTVEGNRTELALTRNREIRLDVPILLTRGDRVVNHKIPDYILREKAVAYYYDLNHGSSFMVWHDWQQREDLYNFFGIFSYGSRKYQVQPVDQGHVNHTLSLVPNNGPIITDYVNTSGQMNDRQTERKTGRQKRQTTTTYEVETFFAVDYSTYTFWYNQTDISSPNRTDVTINNIIQFFAFILNAINVRYASVTGRGYTIICLYAGIHIADYSAAAPYIEDHAFCDGSCERKRADADVVLEAFSNWTNDQLGHVYGYDVIAMFTEYDIGTVDDSASNSSDSFNSAVAGYAYLSGVCQVTRQSINEGIMGGANSATVLAHEIGHNLGMGHDGDVNACLSTDGNVMSPVSSMTVDDLDKNIQQYQFSSCSMDYFEATNDDLGSDNCMENRSTSYNSSALDAFANDTAGQRYGPDSQCQLTRGNGSHLQRTVYTSFEDICAMMACTDASNGSIYYPQLAWEGTTCGNGKLCEAGNCTSSSAAPTGLTETCLFGDTPGTVSSWEQTCADYLGSDNTSYHCYSETNRIRCCETCEIHRQNNINRTNCEYGDQASWCSTLSLVDCYSNDAVCCQSCAEQASTNAGCEYGDKASWCSTLSREGCYNNDAVCCQSCTEQASTNANCLYGDMSTGCEVASCSSYTETTRTETCCETCATNSTTTTVTPSSTTTTTTIPSSTTTTTTTPSSATTTNTIPSSTTTTTTTPSSTTTTTTTPPSTTTANTIPSSTTTTTTTPSSTTTTTTTPSSTTTVNTIPSSTTTTNTIPSSTTTTTTTPSSTTTTTTTPSSTTTTTTIPSSTTTTTTTPSSITTAIASSSTSSLANSSTTTTTATSSSQTTITATPSSTTTTTATISSSPTRTSTSTVSSTTPSSTATLTNTTTTSTTASTTSPKEDEGLRLTPDIRLFICLFCLLWMCL